MLDFLEKTIIVTGHYGSGKTNLSMNLAMDLRRQGKQVALVDLDIVNPYFRTADFAELCKENGIRLVASLYANSQVELPALTWGLTGWLDREETVILDVGGDDNGAIALGSYAAQIQEIPYTMLAVVNRFRSVGRPPEEDAGLVADIEGASRLRVTHIVNNSNLGPATTPEDIEQSVPWAREAARLAGKEMVFTAAWRQVAGRVRDIAPLYPVDVYVKTIWQ